MPEQRAWTAPQDARIRRLRGSGATWDAIAASLAITRYAAIARGRRIGARLPAPDVAAAHLAAFLLDPTREPLPAGHPASWGVIVGNSCLAGLPYPAPPGRDLLPFARPEIAPGRVVALRHARPNRDAG